MHPYPTSIALALFFSLAHAATLPATSHSSATAFSYNPTSHDGPFNWHKISKPANAVCGNGASQSPINIDTSTTTRAAKSHSNQPRPALQSSAMILEKSKYNWHLSCNTTATCGTTTFKGKTYTLFNLHFHAPSEHTMNGVHAPLEMHMVHEAADGSLAVVSTLFRLTSGTGNKGFRKIMEATEQQESIFNVHLPRLGRDRNGYYAYTGSLTTPPCTEGVTWMVSRRRLRVRQEQVDWYMETAGSEQFGNNRPLQELNGRSVSRYGHFA